jgi:choloylglycine hydrolase
MTQSLYRRALPAILFLGWFFSVAHPTESCSSFLLRSDNGLFVGRNDDILVETPVPGILVVNQRGVAKVAFPIDPNQTRPFTWTSRFGSVTFSYAGKDFPDGGMNEAGLVIEEMSLDETQPPKLPGAILLMQPQWIQYQLDSHRTVEEVIASLSKFTPVVGGWHYLVADAKGRVAVIEFINGETVVHTAEDLAPAVLANDTYASCQDGLNQFIGFGGDRPIPDGLKPSEGTDLNQYAGFGGTKPIPEGVYSPNRFARAASLLASYERNPVEPEVDAAFDVLQSLSFGVGTKRSIVHDLTKKKIYFRTEALPEVRHLALDQLDFSAAQPSLCVDLNQRISGDVLPHLRNWRPQDDQPIIEFLFGLVDGNPESRTVTMSHATHGLLNSSETLLAFNQRLRAHLGTTETQGVEN